MPGSKYWANSFIVLKDGKKYWLVNNYYGIYGLKNLMQNPDSVLKVEVAHLLSNTPMMILKKDISLYGAR